MGPYEKLAVSKEWVWNRLGPMTEESRDPKQQGREQGAKAACARYGVQDLWPYFA